MAAAIDPTQKSLLRCSGRPRVDRRNRCVIPISTRCVPCIRKEAPPPNVNGSVADAYTATKDWGFSPIRVDYLIAIVDGGRAGPIWGVRTGFAIPKKTVTPCPPQRVESASLAFL